ncbi:MAG: adenine deaminase C-terminal domain-containing protein [Carboxydocellales bacterium]
MIKDLKQLPGTFLWLLRLVSQADYPGEKEWFNEKDLQSLLELEEVVGTAELTHWPLLYNADPGLLATIEVAKKLGKIVDGHNAGCSYDKLNTIAAAGVSSCHEAITAKEALDHLRLGFWTLLRNSSLRPDFPEILNLIKEGKVSTSRMILNRSTVISKREDIALPAVDGYADLTGHPDLIQAALIDRDGKWVTRGILKNFAPHLAGLASTYNTTTELLTMGRDAKAMALAATCVQEMGGGIVIVDGEEVVLEIPLTLTGLMTTSPSFEQAIANQNLLSAAMEERGYPFHDILYSLLFLTCDFLPGLRLIPYGLYEVQTDTIINPAEPITSVEV